MNTDELELHRQEFAKECKAIESEQPAIFNEIMKEFVDDLPPHKRQVVFPNSMEVALQLNDPSVKELTMSRDYFLQLTQSMQNMTDYFKSKLAMERLKGK